MADVRLGILYEHVQHPFAICQHISLHSVFKETCRLTARNPLRNTNKDKKISVFFFINFDCNIQLFDGSFTAESSLGRICGDAIPTTIMTVTNVLFVEFYSDDSVTFGGFHASYQQRQGKLPNHLYKIIHVYRILDKYSNRTPKFIVKISEMGTKRAALKQMVVQHSKQLKFMKIHHVSFVTD